MKNNMFSKLLLGAAMLLMAASFTACVDDNEDKGMPYLELGAEELPFTLEGGEAFFPLSTNRPWSATLGEGSDWIVVDPMEGVGDTKVEISVPAATRGRVGSISFHLANTYGIYETKTVMVYQGEVEASEVLWHENFGSPEKVNNSWPLVADYAGWEKGGSVGADVAYSAPSGKVSVRAASPISEEYADASASGKLFFGSGEPVFVAGTIAAAGKTAFTLNFGGAYNNYETSATTFEPAKFHVYISGDNKKWSEVNYTLATAGSKWNYATAEFSLKEAAEQLYLMFVADEASVFSMDDVQLVSGGAGGTEIDLSQGTENPNAGGGNDDPKPDGPASTDLPGAGKYMMVWTIEGKAMAATPAETYYMLPKEVTVSNNEIAAAGNETAVWTIEAAESANLFTIKGSDNNYYAMKGEYNSFNKVDKLGETDYAYDWAFTKQSDGSFKIMNQTKQKWVQWDAQYNNVSASTKDGALPKLYKLNEAGTAFVGVAEGGSTPEPTPDPNPSGEGYTEITKIADLAAGDYYIGGFGQSGTLQLFIGKLTSKHGTTVVYNYDSASGALTTESSDKAVIVTFEAVEGQTNSYRIKYDGKYLVATAAKSGNLALVEASDAKAAYYWTFEDKDNTGMKALQGGTTEFTAQLVCSSGTDKNILRSGASTTAGNGIRLYKKK